MFFSRFVVQIFVVFAFLTLSGHVTAAELANQLQDHPAPYLALHGDDPVAWQEWKAEAVDRAREENKILFVSVGYFACHWCHVMQRESYQDDAVAAALNANFISVKVDRELEPALDDRLMNFAQSILGRGGWPLNVFITPEGFPLFAMLYAPKAQFLETLNRLQTIWQDDPDRVRKLVAIEAKQNFPAPDPDLNIASLQQLIDAAPAKMLVRTDSMDGGFGEQTKFPSVVQLEFLLSQFSRNQDGEIKQQIKEFLELTLDAMANRGMHDHLTGGFFRYSVDPGWEIPHFEKMLYDNAGLAGLYMRAGAAFDRADYHQIAQRTLTFMQQHMWHQGALVASFSAVDDDGIEGGHYLWQRQQVKQVLNDEEYQLVAAVWGLDRVSELEAGNQPRWHQPLADYAEKSGVSLSQLEATLETARNKLLMARTNRSLPVDDKLLAGWNALALSAFVQAARQYDNDSFRQTADQLNQFLGETLWDGGNLTRALAKGERHGTASIQDYAYVVRGLLDYAELSGDEQDYGLAETLAKDGWKKFYANNAWYREDGSLLAPPVGSEVMEDGATPSPAGILMGASFEIAKRNKDSAWLEQIRGAVNRGQKILAGNPYWFVSQMAAMQTVIDGS